MRNLKVIVCLSVQCENCQNILLHENMVLKRAEPNVICSKQANKYLQFVVAVVVVFVVFLAMDVS